jgi:DNA-binding MarR family transcriptional regulator
VSPSEARPKGCTNLKLRRLSRTVARGYDADMRPLGLTGAQYPLLSRVVQQGPIAPGSLATALGLDPSTLTRNLRALLDAGWLVQEPGPDARSHRLVATDAGRALRAPAQQRWRVSQERLNRALGAERVIALHALLDECTALLDAAEETADER